MEPAQELLSVWARWMAYCGCAGEDDWRWDAHRWGDVNNPERNSVMDAEMLECFLLPQSAIDKLSIERYGKGAAPEVTGKLNPIRKQESDNVDERTLKMIALRLDDFLCEYGGAGEGQDFSPGRYIEFPGPSHDESAYPPFPDILDSFAMSTSVCLQAKYLITQWAAELSGDKILIQAPTELRVATLIQRLDRRLTAALRGLEDSFAAQASPEWTAKSRRKWPENLTDPEDRLARVRARLSGVSSDLEAGQPYECGWSWGRTIDRPDQRGWFAEPLPYLYFTVMALDSVADLLSRKVRTSGILTDEQSVLAARLLYLWEQTTSYWTALALAPGRAKDTWVIEDVPWTTADGIQTEYWTVYVLRIITSTPDGRSSVLDDEDSLERIVRVLEELAQRARLTRVPVPPPVTRHERIAKLVEQWLSTDQPASELTALLKDKQKLDARLEGITVEVDLEERSFDDPALDLHAPGIRVVLSPDDSQLDDGRYFANGAGQRTEAWAGVWPVYDLAPQVLKLAGRLLQATKDRRTRSRLNIVIDQTWSHLLRRRLKPQSLTSYAWDEVKRLRNIPVQDRPEDAVGSWYITERVVEALVALDGADRARTTAAEATRAAVHEMLEDLRYVIATRVAAETDRATYRQRLQAVERILDISATLAFSQATKLAADLVDKMRPDARVR